MKEITLAEATGMVEAELRIREQESKKPLPAQEPDDALVITKVTPYPSGWMFDGNFSMICRGSLFVSTTGELLEIPAMCSDELFVKSWKAANDDSAVLADLIPAEEQFVTRVVNTALTRAIKSNAIEVRLEPVDSSNFLVLYREKQEWLEADRLFLYGLISQRLNQMADIVIDSNTKRGSQSGIIHVETSDGLFTIHLNTELTERSERIILRVNKEAITH